MCVVYVLNHVASPLPSTPFTPPLHTLHPSRLHPSPLPSTSSPPLHILLPSPPHPSPLPSIPFSLPLHSPPRVLQVHFPVHDRGRSRRDWWGMKEAADSHLRCGVLHLDFEMPTSIPYATHTHTNTHTHMYKRH